MDMRYDDLSLPRALEGGSIQQVMHIVAIILIIKIRGKSGDSTLKLDWDYWVELDFS